MGAAIWIIMISEGTYKKLFSNLNLRNVPIGLKTYTGETIPVLREIVVEVKYQEQSPSAFIDCCERQGPHPVRKRLADAFSIRLKSNWVGYIRKYKGKSRCSSKEI